MWINKQWTSHRRWPFLLIALALILALSLGATGALAQGGLGVNGPCYPLVLPATAKDTMSIVWWDAPEIESGNVRYGTDQSLSDASVVAAGQTRSDGDNYTAWTATLTGLETGATYYYQVGQGNSWSAVHSFTVANDSETDFDFLYFGDAQYNEYTTKDSDYAAWGQLVNTAVAANPQAELAVLGGDMVQQGQQAASWQLFLSNATAFAGLPVLTVPGNHESNAVNGKPAMYLDLFTLPDNGPAGFEEEFYSIDRGDCHIQFLSSNILSNEQLLKGGMTAEDFTVIKNWIAADLAASDATWKIVVMHHPAYAVTSDSVSAAVLEQWVPLFEEAQVDLVLCGHQHVYMRTKALHGVTYVMGVSGAKYYAPAEVNFDEVQIGYVSNYQLISTNSGSLTMTAYNSQGTEIDRVTLAPKDRTVIPVWHDTPGDLNADDVVDEADVEVLLTAIRCNAAYADDYDINNDGAVDIRDAQLLALQVAGGTGND
ncbi:MAG TPA: hypothetical protein GX726_05330 [Clostridiales bacterium]|jgi:3',5'-cyclic AMP phosphodiesterase CpdA|nr:hypothetical protein [Clostridiales bacterium]